MRELKREQEEIINVPDIGNSSRNLNLGCLKKILINYLLIAEAAECADILAQYGAEPHEYEGVVNALRRNPQHWLDFMMK